MTITVKCGVCGTVLIVAEGPELTEESAAEYQSNTSCDQDGQSDIQVTIT